MNAWQVRLCSVQAHQKGTTAAGEVALIMEHTATALAAVRATGTSADAFRQLTQLAGTFGQLGKTVADYRAWLAADLLDSGQCRSLAQVAAELHISKSRAQQLVDAGRKRGNPVADPGTSPELPVVAVAIVIHPDGSGVLMEHRRDEAPPWTFPAAEILPGESPAQALMRRVPGETGTQIGTDYVIGARVHPRTGRIMRYLACHLADPGTADAASAQADDPDADRVEWVSKAQLAERAPDLFGPVARLLDDTLA
jgi:8-oxo-dGTP diphosphatase